MKTIKRTSHHSPDARRYRMPGGTLVIPKDKGAKCSFRPIWAPMTVQMERGTVARELRAARAAERAAL